ncbi:hypothetical protein ACGFX4_17690 [Kitasatospora sp. NPDC048365]
MIVQNFGQPRPEGPSAFTTRVVDTLPSCVPPVVRVVEAAG